ncbi:MAG: transposase, partial [Paraburkholderia sp.]
RRMDTVSQTVELPAKRQNRRHPLEWKRSVVEQTLEPGAAVARVDRENNINANQVWAWRKLYAQGLLVEDAQTQTMLPVIVDAQSDRSTVQAPDAPDAPAPAVSAKGSIQLQHGNTLLRIEGVPDATILRLVLERILR